jgi:RHS repeat-associated protein
MQDVTDSVTGTWSYNYDTLNRLTGATGQSGSYGALPVSGVNLGWSYDSFGNRLGDGMNSYVYDVEGKVCAVIGSPLGTTQYVYDAEGNRVAKGPASSASCTVASSFTPATTFLRGAGGEVVTELGAGGAWNYSNVYAGGALLATYRGSETYFALNDWLGTKRVEVTPDGQVATFASLPFGDFLSQTGTALDATEHHFTGKERDSESGLDYFGARYYGSNMGRFMSPDWSAKAEPVPYSKLDDPQTLNLYAYVGNNPLSRVDPDGHAPPPQYDVDGNQIQRDYGRFDPPHCICGPPPKLPNGNPAPPNVPVPGAPGAKWVWNPDSGNSRGGTWGPDQWDSKTNGPSKPSASWDDEDGKKGKDHWDVDDGKGSRGRYGEDGRPMTPDEAHGRGGTQTATPMSVTPQQAGAAAKGVAWGVIIYWTVSEGSRILFPPRNLVPVP